MNGRTWARAAVASTTLIFTVCLGTRMAARAQQAPQQPAAAPAQTPASQTAAEKFKNIQVLKDIPADQLPEAMQYVAASLGVQCNFCHVLGPEGGFDKDDKPAKKTARTMMLMVQDINTRHFAGDQRVSCASCHHGHTEPDAAPPLAVELTPVEAAAEHERQREMPEGGRGRAGQAAGPGSPQAARPGSPQASASQRPPRPTETVDDVVGKYVQALGGHDALANVKTRVMSGTLTTRDLQTEPVTVQEMLPSAYRIETTGPRGPMVRAYNGTAAWAQMGNGTRELEGLGLAQVSRVSDLGLPLNFKERYTGLRVAPRYGSIDGRQTVILVGTSSPRVTEQLQFDRESGLLVRRSIATRTPLGRLPEQFDYRDYRDVNGVKVPFELRYATWNNVQTEKFTDVKINAPLEASLFTKPSGASRP